MHTYNKWLSKCCTKLLTKELKHLCKRTQLDVKANY